MSDKPKKPNIFVRLGRKIKEVFAELKKVTWPTFGKTVAQTGIVLVVVLFFLVIITGVSVGFSELFYLIFPPAAA
ncbi:MAG: preprotein translocase subunit SecE [Firmicutes bacterium]|nr:preprotein translocase subunit SecE [Bacillota bacterium]